MEHLIINRGHKVGGLLLIVLLAAVGGCSKTASVTGKVRYQGRPVVYGSVVFLAADHTAHSGVIESDGRYAVDSVPPGPVRIGVISPDPAKGRSILRQKKPAQSSADQADSQDALRRRWFSLPPQYESPQTSALGTTLGTGGVRYDIELK